MDRWIIDVHQTKTEGQASHRQAFCSKGPEERRKNNLKTRPTSKARRPIKQRPGQKPVTDKEAV